MSILPSETAAANLPALRPSKTFSGTLRHHGLELRRAAPEILQINTGKLCNLTCTHCHVNAGPKRIEIIQAETVDRILDWLKNSPIQTVDLTGGAPEMVPDFKRLVASVRSMKRRVMDRCNLTILLEPGYEGMAEFLRDQSVEIVASMPCYSPENVNAQRGEGVFDSSIEALRLLNHLGYGDSNHLPLDLVYNPNGAFLPGDQRELESDYKSELSKHFGITFRRLYTITNMPVSRFASWLRHNNQYKDYLSLLISAFNPHSIDALMCRNTINIGWQGEVYDCDFNQQLGLQLGKNGTHGLYLWDLPPSGLIETPILTAEHCFGCTAGAGSSCGGALV